MSADAQRANGRRAMERAQLAERRSLVVRDAFERELLADTRADAPRLAHLGHARDQRQHGAMIETVGTNDLIQYAFAADRQNEEMAYLGVR